MDAKRKEFQVPEHLVLADKLYAKRQHRKVLEARLDERQFQYRCLPQKKEEALREIKWKVIPIIVISAVELFALVVLVWCLIAMIGGNAAGNKVVGIGFLLAFPVASYGGYYCVRTWKHIIWHTTNTSKFEAMEESLRIKITDLQEEIASLNAEIAGLEERLQEKKQEE